VFSAFAFSNAKKDKLEAQAKSIFI